MNILKNVPGSNANYVVVVSPLGIEPYNPNFIYNPYPDIYIYIYIYILLTMAG
jgi:hypothetical protein